MRSLDVSTQNIEGLLRDAKTKEKQIKLKKEFKSLRKWSLTELLNHL